MVNVVNKGLKVEILPDNNMMQVLNQNIGNARFIWNNMLSRYNDLYKLFSSHDYPLNPNIGNLNAILKMFEGVAKLFGKLKDVKARAFFFT